MSWDSPNPSQRPGGAENMRQKGSICNITSLVLSDSSRYMPLVDIMASFHEDCVIQLIPLDMIMNMMAGRDKGQWASAGSQKDIFANDKGEVKITKKMKFKANIY